MTITILWNIAIIIAVIFLWLTIGLVTVGISKIIDKVRGTEINKTDVAVICCGILGTLLLAFFLLYEFYDNTLKLKLSKIGQRLKIILVPIKFIGQGFTLKNPIDK